MLKKTFNTFEQSISKADISMTPLIDMVFILLIFFVVTTTFTKETGISIEKAKASTSQLLKNNLLVIAIDKTGSYWYDNQNRSLVEIVNIILEMTKKSPKCSIVLVPDKNSMIEPLITLMDHLRAHNITQFSLGTHREEIETPRL